MGSPPQVRGKQKDCRPILHEGRITPAGAGKTLQAIRKACPLRDHPRRCGENYVKNFMGYSTVGSPPQVRGKLRYNIAKVIQIRITPAGAGKTAPSQRTRRNAWDHPRRCGENSVIYSIVKLNTGSPPQVRGNHSKPREDGLILRITPAGAGKTSARCGCCRLLRDHPRRCGENRPKRPVRCIKWGSPPQVRGKLHLSPELFKYIGITPAGAGKTPIEDNAFAEIRDHPRRCGENFHAICCGRR